MRFTKEFQDFSTAAIGERLLTDEPPTYQAAVIEKREEAFRKLVSGQIQPMPGLMTLLALADRTSLPIVAVTNAPRRNTELLPSGLWIVHRFKAMVIGDELPHDNLKHVIALSSSVLDEAAIFGVETTRLIDPDRDASDLIPSSVSQWYRIPSEELTYEGFVNAFFGIVSPRYNVPRRRLDLRRSLNTAWGFEGFYKQADLSLRVVPHRPARSSFPHRTMYRALKSIFRPNH